MRSTISLKSSRAHVQGRIIASLYRSQLSHWNDRLRKVMEENAKRHGTVIETKFSRRGDPVVPFGAIIHKGRKHTMLAFAWFDQPEDLDYCFPLAPDADDLVPELDRCIEELAAIKREKYESERFLSALLSFDVTAALLRTVLGDMLYDLIAQHIRTFPAEINPAEEHGLMTFVKNNQAIVDHMNERMVLNLIAMPS